jgi:hypothetical protein
VTTPDAVLMLTTSHRSRERMKRVTGDLQEYFCWKRGSGFYFVPADRLDAVLAIPGIRKCRRPESLHKCSRW